jgi:hypothetical protein
VRAHAHGSRGGLGRQGPHAGSRRDGGWVGGARGGDSAPVCGGRS